MLKLLWKACILLRSVQAFHDISDLMLFDEPLQRIRYLSNNLSVPDILSKMD